MITIIVVVMIMAIVVLIVLIFFFIGGVNELIGLPPPAAKITGSDHMKSHGNTKKHSRIGKE